MSLDVYLELPAGASANGSGIFIRENGSTREITRAEWDERFPGAEPVIFQAGDDDATIFTANITHNLTRMADAAGIYQHLWRPDEIGITVAWELVAPLEAGLKRLRDKPGRFTPLNPANGWGTYEGLVEFVDGYLAACRRYPAATVRVWR